MTASSEYSVSEAAAILGLSVAAVRRRIAQGQLPARKTGGWLWLIPADAVRAAATVGRLPPGPRPRAIPRHG